MHVQYAAPPIRLDPDAQYAAPPIRLIPTRSTRRAPATSGRRKSLAAAEPD